ncbi:hypothetical protein CEXT_691401 [Caerostris extrusa]|uniref:Uncharacterized protein n=1 Tax=Caerostris extrusa TaxID=172846 RepID=A0AAV4UKE2_CAEEX|nr:hypothetical protein CEXT_691401 [Caerostris extrusa]
MPISHINRTLTYELIHPHLLMLFLSVVGMGGFINSCKVRQMYPTLVLFLVFNLKLIQDIFEARVFSSLFLLYVHDSRILSGRMMVFEVIDWLIKPKKVDLEMIYIFKNSYLEVS